MGIGYIICFSQGAVLVGIAERTGGQEFFASDTQGDQSLATLASQTASRGCDEENTGDTVWSNN